MRISIDPSLCQGHGRCYDLAPGLFGADDEGYATLLVPDGRVPADLEDGARLAAANCPESAVLVLRDAVTEEAAR
ncbi:ferredoxin [Geodermatophilus normandii]|uniref:Ferredoxin n=1 Tax=Geodermatophilus normandii TaxID=1137989 RepID=A0A6P0G9T6_9ACTN|nr:ferredoxin [Geodermatophilus normandii]